MCIQWTWVLYSVVKTWQSNSPISQFNSLCNEFTSVWPLCLYTILDICIYQAYWDYSQWFESVPQFVYPCKQSFVLGYVWITLSICLSVCLSICLVSAIYKLKLWMKSRSKTIWREITSWWDRVCIILGFDSQF